MLHLSYDLETFSAPGSGSNSPVFNSLLINNSTKSYIVVKDKSNRIYLRLLYK